MADDDGAWLLQLPDAATVARIRLQPLAVGALHVVVSQRFGRSLPRPTMVRIARFRVETPSTLSSWRARYRPGRRLERSLPSTLAELVRDESAVSTTMFTRCCWRRRVRGSPTWKCSPAHVARQPQTLRRLLGDRPRKRRHRRIRRPQGTFQPSLAGRRRVRDADPAQAARRSSAFGAGRRPNPSPPPATSPWPPPLVTRPSASPSMKRPKSPAPEGRPWPPRISGADDAARRGHPQRQMRLAAYLFDAGDSKAGRERCSRRRSNS